MSQYLSVFDHFTFMRKSLLVGILVEEALIGLITLLFGAM